MTGEKRSGDQRALDARLLHLARELVELCRVGFLPHERLGGHSSHDAFVKRAGDAGVELSRLALVCLSMLFCRRMLMYASSRQHRQRDQRELPREHKHGHDATQRIEKRPEHVDKAPGDHVRQARDIAHHARHDIAHRRAVVKREGELLQAQKRVLANVIRDRHLQTARERDKRDHAGALHEDHGEVEQRKSAEPLSVDFGTT